MKPKRRSRFVLCDMSGHDMRYYRRCWHMPAGKNDSMGARVCKHFRTKKQVERAARKLSAAGGLPFVIMDYHGQMIVCRAYRVKGTHEVRNETAL